MLNKFILVSVGLFAGVGSRGFRIMDYGFRNLDLSGSSLFRFRVTVRILEAVIGFISRFFEGCWSKDLDALVFSKDIVYSPNTQKTN